MLAAGNMVSGRYRLTSLLGEGGAGSVWHAVDETLQRPVAIKLLYVRVHRDPQLIVEQFLREARTAAAIQHRNVVSVVDFGTTEVGVPYMVMELLKGETLAARIEREPRLRLDEILGYADGILRGLAAVHDAGIVHRDLKPQNIFLHRDGESEDAKIIDFGISRSLSSPDERRLSVVTTQQGMLIGTPHYMSPEQARGETEIDKRSDIYNVGAMLYEAIGGRTPFDAETAGELLMKIMSSDPTPLQAFRPDVPALLSDCIAQAMARDRADRFLDARVFRRALHAASETPLAEPIATQVQASAPRSVANANAGWGDFEDLSNRSSPPQRRAASADSGSAAPSADPRGSHPPPSAATDTRDALSVSAAFASGAGSGALAAGPASRPLRPRAASGALAAGRGASGAVAPVRGASGAIAPVRGASGPLARAQSRPELDDVPLIAGAANDGPLLGAHPLDAFAETSTLNLEVDYGPEGHAPPSRRSPIPSHAKRPGMSGHSAAAFEDRKRRIGYGRERSSLRWVVPACLLLILLALLIAPSFFSQAPPDQAEAIQREARNPATRDSARRLSTADPADRSQAPAALRMLQY